MTLFLTIVPRRQSNQKHSLWYTKLAAPHLFLVCLSIRLKKECIHKIFSKFHHSTYVIRTQKNQTINLTGLLYSFHCSCSSSKSTLPTSFKYAVTSFLSPSSKLHPCCQPPPSHLTSCAPFFAAINLDSLAVSPLPKYSKRFCCAPFALLNSKSSYLVLSKVLKLFSIYPYLAQQSIGFRLWTNKPCPATARTGEEALEVSENVE